MSNNKLLLAYSPFNAPSFCPIEPFDQIFGAHLNMFYQKELPDTATALLLWGGQDISPSLYGESPIALSGPTEPSQRDLFEWELLRQAYDKKIPVIGICRGAQIACAFAGGKLVQDVTGHQSNHSIKTNDGQVFFVSSSHHQMLYPYEVEHELIAWSTEHRSKHYEPRDKFYCVNLEQRMEQEPEIVYFPDTLTLAVQCHPEWHHDAAGLAFNAWLLNLIRSKLLKETPSCAC